jgi:hypothetical protein
MMEFVDRELDQFIAQTTMGDPGVRPFTSSMAETWRLVRLMIQKYHVELKLDMFLGVTGEHWVASFYSPHTLAPAMKAGVPPHPWPSAGPLKKPSPT